VPESHSRNGQLSVPEAFMLVILGGEVPVISGYKTIVKGLHI
jgi:hypothetical protein